MLRIALLLVMWMFAGAAMAQQQSYVPFTVDQSTYNQLMNALSEFKYKDAAPIIAGLLQLEQKAQADARSKSAPAVSSDHTPTTSQ